MKKDKCVVISDIDEITCITKRGVAVGKSVFRSAREGGLFFSFRLFPKGGSPNNNCNFGN